MHIATAGFELDITTDVCAVALFTLCWCVLVWSGARAHIQTHRNSRR